MSKKYRKLPVVIDAWQFDGEDFLGWPKWLATYSCVNGEIVQKSDRKLYIPTLEGRMEADIGDYIIKGVAGEIYPCKPDIFRKTYEEVDDE